MRKYKWSCCSVCVWISVQSLMSWHFLSPGELTGLACINNRSSHCTRRRKVQLIGNCLHLFLPYSLQQLLSERAPWWCFPVWPYAQCCLPLHSVCMLLHDLHVKHQPLTVVMEPVTTGCQVPIRHANLPIQDGKEAGSETPASCLFRLINSHMLRKKENMAMCEHFLLHHWNERTVSCWCWDAKSLFLHQQGMKSIIRLASAHILAQCFWPLLFKPHRHICFSAEGVSVNEYSFSVSASIWGLYCSA